MERTQSALSKTLNITAYDGKVLVGCLRILSDGYYFGPIIELLVLPEYQFYEKNGCQKSLQSYTIETGRIIDSLLYQFDYSAGNFRQQRYGKHKLLEL